MIVSLEQCEKMRCFVMEAIISNRDIDMDHEIFNEFEHDAIMSIYGQLFVRNLKNEIKLISDTQLKKVVSRVQNGESLLAIAKEYHLGTFKFAKLYLEATDCKNTSLSSLPTDPTQIADERIRHELLVLIESDPACNYELEQMKEVLGREYEELLVTLLNERHMCFETESQLRSRGKPKTPDVLFLIPMGTTIYPLDLPNLNKIHDGSKEQPNTALNITNNLDSIKKSAVINWIDSKAMFADVQTFKENIDQFRAYNNRYGRGLVIYWHGFVKDVCSLLIDDMIIVRDRFPDNWMFPTGEPADGRIPAFDEVLL